MLGGDAPVPRGRRESPAVLVVGDHHRFPQIDAFQLEAIIDFHPRPPDQVV